MNSVQNPSKYLRFCTETSRVGASLRWWKSPCGAGCPTGDILPLAHYRAGFSVGVRQRSD